MKQNNRKPPGKGINIGKLLFTAFIVITLMACFSMTVFAEEEAAGGGVTIWDKATEIMKDVYDQVLLISTVAAVAKAEEVRPVQARRLRAVLLV